MAVRWCRTARCPARDQGHHSPRPGQSRFTGAFRWKCYPFRGEKPQGQPWQLHPAWWQPAPLLWWSAHSSLQYIRPSLWI